MGFLSKLLDLDRRAPVDETRRKILKTAAVTPLVIPILSGPAENINRAPSDKDNMLDFMQDVLVVTLLKNEMLPGAQFMVMAINGKQVSAPFQKQIYIQRCYVELLANTRCVHGIDDRLRYPFMIHHDPAGELGAIWMENILARAA